jgi:hypothetical protein
MPAPPHPLLFSHQAGEMTAPSSETSKHGGGVKNDLSPFGLIAGEEGSIIRYDDVPLRENIYVLS